MHNNKAFGRVIEEVHFLYAAVPYPSPLSTRMKTTKGRKKFQMKESFLQSSSNTRTIAWIVLCWLLLISTVFNFLSPIPASDDRSDGTNTLRRKVTSSTLLPPSIWSRRKLSTKDGSTTTMTTPVDVTKYLNQNETQRILQLCGKFVYSSLERAIHAEEHGEEVFVATGDIDSMWTRDSVVQMSIYLNRQHEQPWLRFIVEGAIRQNAFNIVQDPYANAYRENWVDPRSLSLKDQVIGRGGFVATRNYELDSGAYFLNHLYDYYVTDGLYRPDLLLQEPMIVEAVLTLINVWIVEQHHDTESPYRYFELPNEGKGSSTAYTGMTWSGFRPSDDACKYGYLIPANIHAAGALERILILNDEIWHHDEVETKARQLLKEIEIGIATYGVVKNSRGERVYAYEVDGMGGILQGFDDANVPSLLSIPLLGWTKYDKEIYRATRKQLLSSSTNQYFYEGSRITGIGSPHTPIRYVWPMAMVIQGLTEEEEEGGGTSSSSSTDRAQKMAFQMKQLLRSACKGAMHESVNVNDECRYTRDWFEWANALFVVYVESVLGVSCSAIGDTLHVSRSVQKAQMVGFGAGGSSNRFGGRFYSDPYHNDAKNPLLYQGVAAAVPYNSEQVSKAGG